MLIRLADHKIVERREQRRENFTRYKDEGWRIEWGKLAEIEKKLFKDSTTETPSEALREELRIFKKYNVPEILEIGCGSGTSCIFLAKELKGVKVTGLDNSEKALAVLEETVKKEKLENLRTLFGSATKIPAGDESYGGVLSHLVMDLLKPQEREKAVSEMARIAKTGGVAIVAGFFSEKEMGELIKAFENNKLKPVELITNPEKTRWVLAAEKRK
jgi:ubiquinone/menaquinone biosynthesis C-methylase UbiE